MDAFDLSRIRSPKVRLNPPMGSVEVFPIDIAGILALAGFSELLEVPVPKTAIQLAVLSSDTVLHWSSKENAELLAWLGSLVTDGSISTIQIELDLPDGGTLMVSRNVKSEWDTLYGWLTRNST